MDDADPTEPPDLAALRQRLNAASPAAEPAEALAAWAQWGEQARAEGERRLGNQLVRVSRIGEQLLTLRAIQTMARLDLRHYRDHIHALGGYGDATGDTVKAAEDAAVDADAAHVDNPA